MARRDGGGREYLRYIGLGFEFAAIVCLGFYAGNWIDEKYDLEPWGLLIGGFVGLVSGIYLLAREGLKAMKQLDGSAGRGTDRDAGDRR